MIAPHPNFQMWRPYKNRGFDRTLLLTVSVLLSLGIVMVYSASIAADSETLHINFNLLIKQLIYIGLGTVALIGGAHLNPDWLQKMSRGLLVVGCLLLAAVLVPTIGVEVNGGMRWIDIAGFRAQPSELVKIIVIIYFSDYFSRKFNDLHCFKVGTINVGIVVGLIGGMLLLEPDYGSTVVIVLTVASMIFLSSVYIRHFFISTGVACMLLAGLIWVEPYRLKRLVSYWDPWIDQHGGGFQVVQALIAIGRGEWFGIGLGGSIQKLFYLKHASNDFLIAVVGEELGAAGIVTVLFLFMLLLWRAFAIAQRALRQGHLFAGFLAQGIGILIALQAAIHIGVNIGFLPNTGLTLPLMSYGGSSMISTMGAIGLLFSVDRYSRQQIVTKS